MIKLSVNIDHVATLRQARGGPFWEPDPVAAAVVCLQAGADGITVHLRLDRRHIQERDLRLLRQVVKRNLNLEMAVTEEMMQIALDVKPDICTLVPERPEETTTEGGLDVVGQKEVISRAVEHLHKGGIKVSLFIEPEEDQVRAAKEVGADMVELYTGSYAETSSDEEEEREFNRLLKAAQLAGKLGLGLRAGHSLTFRNLHRITTLPNLREVSIGHNIIARAVFIGLDQAVKEVLAVLRKIPLVSGCCK
ncbi:pyridoxine 5'-phosphate synthase [Candidatus Bathyarchaeota archaeon]|nr:pyridoxine 5'-phosphate synthase [Candidatus Bathyarchaeota archaeon]